MNCPIKSDGIYYSKVPNGYLLLLLLLSFFFFFFEELAICSFTKEKGTIPKAHQVPTELYFAFYKLKTKEISSAKQELELS